ncbi:MAG: ABC transporter ATP-binding protein [Clostridia bacterium]
MLKIENVSKAYAGSKIKAVDDLTLEIKEGEIFGFLGPNGAGKSTTIKMIVGILKLDQGKITLSGQDVTNSVKARLNIGYVADTHDTFDKLTGQEYINFMGEMYEVPQDEINKRSSRFIEMFNLGDSINSQIKTYSHGMKQKILVIGALLHNPKLWILDEPLTGLDPQSAYELKQLMREHVKNGNTVFFSSHVIEVVEKLCDRIAIINHGKLVTVDTLDNILTASNATLEETFLRLTKTQSVESTEIFK